MRPVRALGLVLLGSIALGALRAQETPAPAPAPTPTPAAPAPAAPAVAAPSVVPTATPPPTTTRVPWQRLVDPPVISVSRLPAENPYGTAVEEPAALTGKPAFPDATVSAPLFVAVRVDPTGRVTQSRIARDPIPSVSAESKKSLDRWSFDPAVKGGRPVETWASLRLDAQIEVRAPRTEQPSLTPVTPATALPVPFQWGVDAAWYDNLSAAVPSDGTVAVEQLDALPVPKRTKWSADSYRGPFSCRFWVKVAAGGRIEKSIPIQASDPILIAYMRRAFPSWQLNPARVKGQPVESWNELSVSGQIAYSIEVKQIGNLRKTLPGG